MSQPLTLQSLVDRSRSAQVRHEKKRLRRIAKRDKQMAEATVAQLHHNLSDLPYIRQLFPFIGEPTIEQVGRKLALVIQPVANNIGEETLVTQIEQYCGDICLYLRLTHEPSRLFTCLKLSRFQHADRALLEITTKTEQLLESVKAWQDKQERNYELAELLLSLIHDWYALYFAWSNQCSKIAQDLIEQHWTPHMLYRLHYVSGTNPAQVDADSNLVERIVTCTEPNSGRISYSSIARNGDHSIQIILGGLLNYEPLVFHDKPEVNQLLPYHSCHSVGPHTICLPPCNSDVHEPLHPPPAPPDIGLFLSENGVDPLIAGTVGLYLNEQIDRIETIQNLCLLMPEQFIEMNPDGIFSL